MSGFLDQLEFGDSIMANRGFRIDTELAARGCTLIIPAFMKGKLQMPGTDLESTQRIAHARIHVERLIGILKNRFRIFKSTVDIHTAQGLDEIVTIQKSIIPPTNS